MGGFPRPVAMRLVSTIITSYNRLEYLKRAVESVMTQEYPAMEIVVTDDHSKDGSWDYVMRMSRDFGIVGVRQAKNFGAPTRPRNDGLFASSGEMVNFLDEDNMFLPGRVLSMVGEMKSGVDMVYCNSQCVLGGNLIEPPWGFVPDRFEPELLNTKNYIDLSEPIISRKAVERAGFFDEKLKWNEEWDLWRRYTKAGLRIVCVPIRWNKYNVHREDSRSGKLLQMEIKKTANGRIAAKHKNPLAKYRADVFFGEKRMSFTTVGQFDGPERKDHMVVVCRNGKEQEIGVTVLARNN